jgi:hypothetical protein
MMRLIGTPSSHKMIGISFAPFFEWSRLYASLV